MRIFSVAAVLALAGLLPAQACGSLAITGGAPGSQLSIALSGAPANGFAVLVVGEQAGSTSIPLPIGGSLILGVAEPFFPVPLGQTDGQLALAALEASVHHATRAAVEVDSLDEVGTATPLLDWCSLRHETQYTRLFRS
jgi:hypothetical protein